jgi:heme/copper-type cytochrome/quinol oxidase subunit 2
MINIDFTKTDGVYTLQDALWLEDDHIFTDAQIEAMKQERFDNWVAIITTPEAV